jgi:predicted nucleotidyltransferase
MDISLPPDFKEFLRLLNENRVEYLLIGDYAVGYHGYPRATQDIDLWIAVNPENAAKMVTVLSEFGFDVPELTPDLFLHKNKILRMGVPPIRIEVATSISGVSFADCHAARVRGEIDGVPVAIIGLDDLKKNKKASGRHRNLDDLEHLP